MGKRLSQLTLIEGANLDKEDYLLIDGERYLESKKVKLKDIDLNKFNTSNFYNKNQVDSFFVKTESGKGLSTNDFTNEDKDKLDNSQEKLVDRVNIKTINGESILGEGDIEISGGGGGSITVKQTYDPTSTDAVSGKAVAGELVRYPTIKSGTDISSNGIADPVSKGAFTEATKHKIPKVNDFYFNTEEEVLYRCYSVTISESNYTSSWKSITSALENKIFQLESALEQILEVIQSGNLNTETVAEIEQIIVSYLENKTIAEVEA